MINKSLLIIDLKKNEKRIYLFFRDNWGRKWSHVLAIDALHFRRRSDQYYMKPVKRELIKAYTGFYSESRRSDCSFPIATGNWGCGVFNGDRQLKG